MAKKVWLWFSFLLIASLIAAGCTGPQTVQRPPLKVEWTDWEGDYTLLVAQEKGFFEKHGVAVEPVYYGTFSKAIPDLSAHKLDAGLFGLSDVFTASRVAEIKTVAIYDSGGTVAVVSSTAINTVADLKGKKVGVVFGTYGEMFVRQMLSSAQLTIKDVELIQVDPEGVPAALSNNAISAGYVWAPLDQQAVKDGHKILYSQVAGLLSPDVIVFRADVVESRPDDVRAFLDAWFEAADFRNNNPEESRQIIAKITNQDLAEVSESTDLKLYSREENLQFFNSDPAKEDTIYNFARANLDFRIVRGDITFLPDLEAIFDPSFLK